MPPRRFNSEDEISLRHLPDTSDSSFSFQIPNALSGDDRLLDEDDLSFFRDTNDDDVISAMSGPDRSNFNTLTVEELSRPVSEADTANDRNHSSQALLAGSGFKAPLNPDQAPVTRAALSKGKMKPNLKVTTQSTQTLTEFKSSGMTRHETLRAEFQALNNEAPDSSDPPPRTSNAEPSHQNEPKALRSRRERPAMKTERLRAKAVVSGGGVKTRSRKAAPSSGYARNAVSVPAIQQEALLPPETQSRVLSDNADFLRPGSPDISICSTAPGGVAERLLMYSQTLLSSFGPAMVHDSDTSVPTKGDPESSSRRRDSIAENVDAYHTGDGRNDPLTLSQISPCKATNPQPSPPAIVLPSGSPMRQSTKRPASAPSSPQPAAKKGRNLAVSDDASAIVAPAAQSAGFHAPVKCSSSGSGSRRAQRTRQQTRDPRGASTATRQEPTPTTTSSLEDLPTTLSRSDTTCSSSSSNNNLRFSRSDNSATSGSGVRGHGEAGSSRSVDMPRRHERVVHPPAITTKSVGFKFQIDARIEARKPEFEKEKLLASQKPRKQNYHQVPDFKTIHAVEEARLALRKENIAPTVPLPFELSTDGRAREREKFEEHLREKERESRRAFEQQRREEEEMEERAIRELRKKAVPKAHEVPEWYKDVPKRKVRDLDTNRD